MHTPQEPKGLSDILQQAVEIADAAQDGANFAEGPFTISICDVDLPAFIWDRTVYVQIPLEGFFDAVVASVSEVLRNLEAGISAAGSAALSSADFRNSLSRTPVVIPRVVPDSGEQR